MPRLLPLRSNERRVHGTENICVKTPADRPVLLGTGATGDVGSLTEAAFFHRPTR